MPRGQRRTPAARAFSHLTEEERMDRACELLAMGVLRLAEKRGLLKKGLHSEADLDGKKPNDEEST